jgi:hypothetical protein
MGASPVPPNTSDELLVTIPLKHVLLLIMNRPAARNAMTPTLTADIERTMDWFDEAPKLWYDFERPWNGFAKRSEAPK